MSKRLASKYLQALESGDSTEVGLFIRLPDFLAEQYPSLGAEDTSPPHVTFLYSGVVEKDRQEEWLSICQQVLGGVRGPVRAACEGSVDTFKHAAQNRTVFFSPVRFSHDLAAIRWQLRDALLDSGFDVLDQNPLVYRPHVTLAYVSGLDVSWTGVRPRGAWEFDEVEVWGLPQVETLHFSSKKRQKLDAVTYLDEPGVGPSDLQRRLVAKELATEYLRAPTVPFV